MLISKSLRFVDTRLFKETMVCSVFHACLNLILLNCFFKFRCNFLLTCTFQVNQITTILCISDSEYRIQTLAFLINKSENWTRDSIFGVLSQRYQQKCGRQTDIKMQEYFIKSDKNIVRAYNTENA